MDKLKGLDWKIVVILIMGVFMGWQFFTTDKVDLSVYEQKIEQLEKDNKELENENETLNGEITELREEREVLNGTIDGLNEDKIDLEIKYDKLKERKNETITYVNNLTDDELIEQLTDYFDRK